MNKMYEAPKAEVIEMQMPVVLMESNPAGGGMGPGTGADTTDDD